MASELLETLCYFTGLFEAYPFRNSKDWKTACAERSPDLGKSDKLRLKSLLG
jgi:hypothetical protein